MKAFEKWRNKNCTDGINWTDDKRDKQVWRAALEWARDCSGFSNETTVLIEEELES